MVSMYVTSGADHYATTAPPGLTYVIGAARRTKCKPMRPAMILRIHSIISAVLDLAVRYEWTDRNVARTPGRRTRASGSRTHRAGSRPRGYSSLSVLRTRSSAYTFGPRSQPGPGAEK